MLCYDLLEKARKYGYTKIDGVTVECIQHTDYMNCKYAVIELLAGRKMRVVFEGEYDDVEDSVGLYLDAIGIELSVL